MSTLLASQRRRSGVAAESLRLQQRHPTAILAKRVVTSLGHWLRQRGSRPLPDPGGERLDNHQYLERERRELAHARYASLIRPF